MGSSLQITSRAPMHVKVTPQSAKSTRDKPERNKESEFEQMQPLTVWKKILTLQELQMALRKLKIMKSPGPDGITNDMLKHFGWTAQINLLDIFNLSWHDGTLPQIWREAIMTPVLKKGKDKKKAASYRPISLTSCLVKTLERIINSRLHWYLASESIIVPEQAGFIQLYSTEDQVKYLSQEIEDAFQERKLVLAGWIDL